MPSCNSYFSSLGNDLVRIIPSIAKKKNPKDCLHNCIQPSFFTFSTTLSEIEDEISKLKSGKSTGPVSVYQSRYPQTFEDCSPIKTT